MQVITDKMLQVANKGTRYSNPHVDEHDLLQTAGIADIQIRAGYVPPRLSVDRHSLPPLSLKYLASSDEMLRQLIDDTVLIKQANPRAIYLLIAWMCMAFDDIAQSKHITHLVASVYIRIAVNDDIDDRYLKRLDTIAEGAFIDAGRRIRKPEDKTRYYYSTARNTWAVRLARPICVGMVDAAVREVNNAKLAGGIMIGEHVPLLLKWIHITDEQCFKLIHDLFLKMYINYENMS